MRSLVACFSAALALAAASPALAQVSVAVDPGADLRVISPLIYGLNFPSDAHVAEGRITVARWGGNGTTRYNYEIDVHNSAADYYFENLPGCWNAEQSYCSDPPLDPKEASSANAFLAGAKDKGMIALFTIPTMGWVPKPPAKYEHPFQCGCPKTVTANQDSFDPYDTNCGNGFGPGKGYTVPCGLPDAINVPASPDWAKTWVAYIVSKFGPANGKRIYALDNEPALWSSTHYDLRGAQKLGYDELWQRMRDYAVAILEADPTAEISGPAEWGWPNYFCSDLDDVSKGCSADSPDRKAHGGQELVAWLLEQAKAFEQQNGKRILHYLDLHYYPQGGTVPEVTRSLWDPAYQDPSWINEKIRLLPRMREWVDMHYPGTKTAISEWDFYSHDQAIGAVTYAEVLGLFAREGLDMATAWSPPDPAEPAFAAFKLYRNYDGKGGQFEAVSVRATVTGSGVQAYAATGASRLTVVLVNEEQGDVGADVSFGDFVPSGAAEVFTNGKGSAIDKKADVAIEGGKAKLTLPATSITLLVVAGMNPNELPDAGASSSSSSAAAGGGEDGSGGSGGSAGKSSGGCGCRAAGGDAGALAVIGAAGLLAIAARRRRDRLPARRQPR